MLNGNQNHISILDAAFPTVTGSHKLHDQKKKKTIKSTESLSSSVTEHFILPQLVSTKAGKIPSGIYIKLSSQKYSFQFFILDLTD